MELVRRSGDRADFPDNIYGYGVPDMWKAYQDYLLKDSHMESLSLYELTPLCAAVWNNAFLTSVGAGGVERCAYQQYGALLSGICAERPSQQQPDS